MTFHCPTCGHDQPFPAGIEVIEVICTHKGRAENEKPCLMEKAA